MTLLVSVFAAAISTVLWYKRAPEDHMKLHILCCMYWGASLMWLVDAVFSYMELGAAFFTPPPGEMVNDAYLGLSAVALGLTAWLAILLIKDPKGAVKAVLLGKGPVRREYRPKK